MELPTPHNIRPEMPVVSPAKKTGGALFGINPYTWIFTVAAFIVAVTAFAFPISCNDWGYRLLNNAEKSATPILFTLPVVGFLAGCFRNKVWRTVFMAIVIICVGSMSFFSEGSDKLTPAWGSIIFLAAAYFAIKLCLSDNKRLSEYPNPFHDRGAAVKWTFAALAILTMLVFVFGDIFYNKFLRHELNGSELISTALFSISHSDYDAWYVLAYTLLPAMSAAAFFSSKRWISIVLTALIYLPAMMLMHDASKSEGAVTLKMAFWIYLILVTLMLYMSIIWTLHPDIDIFSTVLRSLKIHKKQLLCFGLPIVIVFLIIGICVNYNSAESVYKRGMAAYEQHDWESAADNLLRAARMPKSPGGFYEGFEAAFRTTNRELQIKALNLALTRGSGNEEISERVGLALWTGEFSPEISIDHENAVEWLCRTSEARRNELGDEMARAGNYAYAYRLYATYPYVDSPIYGLVRTKPNANADYDLAHDLLWNAPDDSLYAVARGDIFLFGISRSIAGGGSPDYASYLECANRQYELGAARSLDADDARLRQQYIAPLLNAGDIQSKVQYKTVYDFPRAYGVSIFTTDGTYGAKFFDKHVTIGRYDQAADSILSPALDLRFEEHTAGIVAREIK